MTAEQFWPTWDAAAAAIYSAKNPPYWMKFAEAYHRSESAAQLAEKEREIARLQSLVMSLRPSTLEARAEAAEQRLQEAQAEIAPLKEWQKSVLSAIKTIPEFTVGQWAGDKEGWGFCFEIIHWLRRERESLDERLRQREAELEHAVMCMDRNCQQCNAIALIARTKDVK